MILTGPARGEKGSWPAGGSRNPWCHCLTRPITHLNFEFRYDESRRVRFRSGGIGSNENECLLEVET